MPAGHSHDIYLIETGETTTYSGGDAKVLADPNAKDFGTDVSERILVPGDDARLGETRFEDWLRGSQQ